MKKDKPKYSHDAPSLMWEIYGLIEDDKIFEAEDLIYETFDEVREEVIEEIKLKGEINSAEGFK